MNKNEIYQGRDWLRQQIEPQWTKYIVVLINVEKVSQPKIPVLRGEEDDLIGKCEPGFYPLTSY